MNTNNLAIATMTWARNAEEESLLREALTALAAFNIPVFVTDGGSPTEFITFLQSFPNFTVCTPGAKGLWAQVRSSLQAALNTGASFVLYTEPDKKDFFTKSLRYFLSTAAQDEETGIVLASRTPAALATFPKFQRTSEITINFCCGEITGSAYDYTYGPFFLNRKTIESLLAVQQDMGWGWRLYAFCIAYRLGFRIDEIAGEFECPADQRTDSAKERVYRMKQLTQSIHGIVQASEAAIS